MKRLLWICCYDSNYPWGAEVAMMRGFKKSGLEIDYIDYRMCDKLGVNLYDVVKRRSSKSDAMLLQRGEGIDINALTRSAKCPLFYFATESEANEDQTNTLRQLVGKVTKIFARNRTRDQAIELGHDEEKVSVFTLPFNSYHYKPLDIDKRFDVIFGGSVTPRREKLYNQVIKEVSDWGKAGYTSESGEGCGQVYNMARSIVNIHAYDVLDTEVRIFEVMATSALLITEELADDIDVDGCCLVFDHNDIDQCVKHIRWVKENPDKVKKMVSNAQKLAAKHSWAERAGELLDAIAADL